MSLTMETELHLIAGTLPAEYRKKMEVECGETFADGDEVPDVPVEIEYEGGWSTPAKLSGPPEDCYPAEGEDPEITSIKIDGNHEILTVVTAIMLAELVNLCWEDQKEHGACEEPDYDEPYDDDPGDYDGPGW